MARAIVLGLLTVCCLGVASACGGGGSSQPAGSIKVSMTEFKFDPSSISAKPGKITFYLVNAGSVPHDMVVSSADGKRLGASELVQAGNTTVFTLDNVNAGGYKFVCDQPGHEENGMKGTLTVA
jgi:plastocyanin